jgi:non-ribosomal peptide synthetase component E (peptide arylation enzyme)
MTQLILDLPDELAERARTAGLFNQQAIVRLLDTELQRRGAAAQSRLPISQVSETERLHRVRHLQATMDRIAVVARQRGLTDQDIVEILRDE